MSVARTQFDNPRCAECGMALESWREYHPLEACQLYALTKDADEVRRLIRLQVTPVAIEARARR
jgi:tRNA(Ile2) C34 agmatinyltransferase TiaS